MFNPFDHYLSYGSTDQETVRDLPNCFTGLLIPGTIAAFQSEGTKGFISSLTARSGEPYVIDPRFPLFQNQLVKAKKSHLMLADIFGVPELVNSARIPLPRDFDPGQLTAIARNWIDFNCNFEDVEMKTFEKYAARLNEPVLLQDSQEPTFILPPYTMTGTGNDGWWEVSTRLWNESIAYSRDIGVENKLRRVVASKNPRVWGNLASEIREEEIVGWISNLNELEYSSEALLMQYGFALKEAKERGQKVFALYGGFFSVLLARHGLTGASHGIGFGEHRNSIELPTSGAPPARYYIPRLHRYVGVEIAVALWRQYPELVSCDCQECLNGTPAIGYHALMRHSVRVRDREIREWANLPTPEVVVRLKKAADDFEMAVSALEALPKVKDGAKMIYSHLEMWVRVLNQLE